MSNKEEVDVSQSAHNKGLDNLVDSLLGPIKDVLLGLGVGAMAAVCAPLILSVLCCCCCFLMMGAIMMIPKG